MFRVEIYGRVRRAVLVEKRSQCEVAREFGISRKTIQKMLRYAVPPGYQREQPVKWLGVIDTIQEGIRGGPRSYLIPTPPLLPCAPEICGVPPLPGPKPIP
jgi:hypothetical protein